MSRLSDSSRLPSPRFTPAVKHDDGHDVNISRTELRDLVGSDLATRLETASIQLFDYATSVCEPRGIYLADTKFEFGFVDGALTLIDEILTPDSSRFWDRAMWREGSPSPSFDKQFVRDHLAALKWDKTPPGPELPADVVAGTAERYRQAVQRICGLEIA